MDDKLICSRQKPSRTLNTDEEELGVLAHIQDEPLPNVLMTLIERPIGDTEAGKVCHVTRITWKLLWMRKNYMTWL